ncbi:hypothetical protein H0H10_38520 [Streptomyces sp. TRM S81-3]|uniref:Uncharacterized protein n=1 Tax=Streptomyces griseicoloratus TaxID=2752516 RepID=A0A926QVA2_9ACTN|nr:hypothetical protein [Streptomyces griseicoloratus]MBD0425003.1 hypothetical protein [Streptomyces griseicoloratus]
MLALVVVLGVAAEIIEPLGDVLKGQGFIGGSFAALVALVLFDAVSESEPREVSGVYVLADLEELGPPAAEAFEARNVRVDFSGFSMQTLLGLLRPSLTRLGDQKTGTQELTLRLVVAHLNLPLSLPGKLEPAPDAAGLPARTHYFGDSPENRERMREEFTRRNWNELKELLDRVHERNPHIAISCEVRESPHVPERKLYIFNQEKVFSAPYGIRSRTIDWRGHSIQILDTEGYGARYGNARIIGWDRRTVSRSTQEIAEHHMEWHRNLWDTLEYVKPERPVLDDPRWVPPEERPAG